MFDKFDKEKKQKSPKEKKQDFGIGNLSKLSDEQIEKIGQDVKKLAPLHPAVNKVQQRIKKLEEKGRRRGRRNMLIGLVGALLIAIFTIVIVYFWTQEVYDISEKADQDILKIQHLNNRGERR